MMLNILVNLLCCYQNVEYDVHVYPIGLMPFVDGCLEAPFGNSSLSETINEMHQPYWLTMASMQPLLRLELALVFFEEEMVMQQ